MLTLKIISCGEIELFSQSKNIISGIGKARYHSYVQ